MKTENIKYIYYTGICANDNYLFTPDEFTNLMLKVNNNVDEKYKVKKIHKMNLKKWIKFSGAEVIYK